MPFRLSGEVVNDRVSVPGWEVLGVSEEDTIANAGVVSASSMGISQDTCNNNWRPSTSTDDCGLNGGSLALSHMVRTLIMQQRPSLLLTPEHLTSVWENIFSHEQKEKISNVIVKKLGAHHGQKVLCEGR